VAVDPFADAVGDELVVATPELVTFGYQLAGPGSRFLAQLIDFPIQAVLLTLAVVGALSIGSQVDNVNLALTIALILAFIVVWGYFPVSEAAWSGKTLGKFVFGLRVVGDQGEPVTLSQAFVRNLVRIVDFLPFFYGFGIIALFWNGRGKRLGDLAAGTVVVRERAPLRLDQLAALPAGPTAGPALAPPEAALLRGLEPAVRDFVRGYASRRPQLDPWRRWVLATRAEPLLRRTLPEVVNAQGPLAALDRLADLASSEPSD